MVRTLKKKKQKFLLITFLNIKITGMASEFISNSFPLSFSKLLLIT